MKILSFFSIVFLLLGIASCKQRGCIKKMKGYIVYEISNKIRFVETVGNADTNYIKHFSVNNFSNAISFEPNCAIQQIIENIKPDTLFDENPDMKEYARFLKYPLVFPAEITIVDTATIKPNELPFFKFKMIYKKALVEFKYTNFNGVVIDVCRINGLIDKKEK